MRRYRDRIVADVCRLVEIPSVLSQGEEGAPFGREVERCLDAALEMMAGLGFRTCKDPGGKYGWAEVGEGPLFGVLGHLDVVNARREDGWSHDPFQPVVEDGWLWGRGTQDDKGPVVAAAYALKSLLDDGYALNHRVRFIFGTDEENLWRCIQAYCAREEIPQAAFTPDSTFPLTYAEKGLLQLRLRSPQPAPVPCRGGDSFNAVSAWASCPRNGQVEAALDKLGYPFHAGEGEIRVQGTTAHAKNPWKGVSANLRLLRALKEAGYTGDIIRFTSDVLEDKFRFEGFTGEDLSDFSGPVTVNLGKFSWDGTGGELCLDLRLPVGRTKEEIFGLVAARAGEYGLTAEEYDWLRPIHVPLDSPLVVSLLGAYRAVTGDEETEPYISAGATYARAFDNCVAFGANLPTAPTSEHQPNERVRVDNLLLAAQVYRQAFLNCVVEKG